MTKIIFASVWLIFILINDLNNFYYYKPTKNVGFADDNMHF